MPHVELARERIIGESVVLADGSELDLRLFNPERQAAVRKFTDAAEAKLAEIGKVLGWKFSNHHVLPPLDQLQHGRISQGRPMPSVINPELIVNRPSLLLRLHIAFLPPRLLNIEGDILEGSTVVISEAPIREGRHATSIPYLNQISLDPEQRRVEFRGDGPYGETFKGSVSSTKEGSFRISTRTIYDIEKYTKAVFEEAEEPLRTGPPL